MSSSKFLFGFSFAAGGEVVIVSGFSGDGTGLSAAGEIGCGVSTSGGGVGSSFSGAGTIVSDSSFSGGGFFIAE